jgi:hypothetical protein
MDKAMKRQTFRRMKRSALNMLQSAGDYTANGAIKTVKALT